MLKVYSNCCAIYTIFTFSKSCFFNAGFCQEKNCKKIKIKIKKNLIGVKMEVITLHKCFIKLMSVDPQMKQVLVTIANVPFCAILLFIP